MPPRSTVIREPRLRAPEPPNPEEGAKHPSRRMGGHRRGLMLRDAARMRGFSAGGWERADHTAHARGRVIFGETNPRCRTATVVIAACGDEPRYGLIGVSGRYPGR